MIINNLKEKFECNKMVKFKLFSLEYIIEIEGNKVCVYPILYPTRKKEYFSLEDALNNYTIYNDNIIENSNFIILI